MRNSASEGVRHPYPIPEDGQHGLLPQLVVFELKVGMDQVNTRKGIQLFAAQPFLA